MSNPVSDPKMIPDEGAISAPAFAPLVQPISGESASDITITQNAALPTVTLSVSANAGTEAGTTVITVTATASAVVTGAQTVDVAVTGTGITAGDFTLSSPQITIANGATSGSVTFTVVNDALSELLETAILTISNPSAGITLGATTQQSITITSDEVEPSSLIVTTNADVVNNSDGLTSLREAIAFANSATAGTAGTGDADNDGNALDTIRFDSTVFATGGVIRLDSTLGTLVVTSAVKIDGTTAGGEVVITGDTSGNDGWSRGPA